MADFQIENGGLIKYTGAGGDVVVPEDVTSIGDFAFSQCESVVSVTLPEGLTSIGSHAFLGCDSLKRIAIPQSVTVIGSGAFKFCTNLEAVTLPKHIAAISDDTFFACINLANIAIPESVTSIGSKAFCDCWNFTSITIPEGVTDIGKNAFCDCHGLTSVTIPGSVTSIGDEAFEKCEYLTSITIPEGVRSIGSSIFSECDDLVSVLLPQSLTAIGDNAFERCRHLAGIVIPENITSFGQDVFLYCSGLQVISLPKSTEHAMPFFLGEGCNTGVMLRSGGKCEYIAFSSRAASHKLSAFAARQSGWMPYDMQLIDNGPRFKYSLPARLLGILGRLQDPESLTDENREMFLDILAQNIQKLVPLAELMRCPEMIQAAVETGAVNASNRKALRKLLSASPIPEISALASQKLTAPAPEKKKKTAPASPLAAEYAQKLKEINGEHIIKNMRLVGTRLPTVRLKDGTPAPEALFLFILAAYCAQYDVGFCEFIPEADAAAELLQYDSLCRALDAVSDHLNVIMHPTLLPLLCRFGTPVQIQQLIDSAAQGWQRFGKKGQRAEKALRESMNLSDTRAAVLWLHNQNRLKRYAALRNLSGDEVYEKYLSGAESAADNIARP